MANILLTEKCVRSCPYCFAQKHMSSADDDYLTWEDLIYIIDLFDIENAKQISLLGGEPTMHPDYVDFVLYLAARNFHSTTFTCGIMSPKKLKDAAEAFSKLDKNQYSFVCNLNHPDMSTDKENERIDDFMTTFTSQVTLSFNIFDINFTMDYLFEYIERFNLHRHIRLGLAHPIPGENNSIISRDNFKIMGEKLTSYVPKLIEHDVSVGFDCGFPMCIFTDEQLGKLMRVERGGDRKSVRFVCNPALDIGPDMNVWSCFPLSAYHKRSIYDFDSVKDMLNYFEEFHKTTREKQAGILSECEYCRYKANGLCMGGCLAHVINDLNASKADKEAAK